MTERRRPDKIRYEAVAHIVGSGTLVGTEVTVREAGRSGAEEDVVGRGALIQVDGMGPGVGDLALETVAEALVELYGQAVIIAQSRILELRDLAVFRIDAS